MECVQESANFFGLPKALVDELAGKVIIKDYRKWSYTVFANTGIEFGTTKGDVTGKILYDSEDERHNTRKDERVYQDCWAMTLKRHLDKLTGEYLVELHILGNPSKIFYNGKNYGNIPLFEFNKILIEFAEAFCLNLDEIEIACSTEASVTVDLNPEEFVLNENTFRHRVFSGVKGNNGKDKYREMENSADYFMGYEYQHGQITNKIYLPALKFREPLNSARIEVRFDVRQSIEDKTTIRVWADLLKPEGHYQLGQVVLKELDKTIIIDPSLRRNNKKYQSWLNEMVCRGKKAEYWWNEFPKTASDKTLKERLKRYRNLSFEKGDGLHTRLSLLVEKETEKLRFSITWLTARIPEGIETKSDITDRSKQETEMNKDTRLKTTGNTYLYSNMNKKQMAKFKRFIKQDQYNRFMKALEITLNRIAA